MLQNEISKYKKATKREYKSIENFQVMKIFILNIRILEHHNDLFDALTSNEEVQVYRNLYHTKKKLNLHNFWRIL